MTRLSQSFLAGIFITIIILIIVFFTDTGDSERSIVERHPFAYIFFWPDFIFKHILSPEPAALATLLFNVILYSALTYALLRWRAKTKLI